VHGEIGLVRGLFVNKNGTCKTCDVSMRGCGMCRAKKVDKNGSEDCQTHQKLLRKILLHYDSNECFEGHNIYKKLCPITVGFDAHVRNVRKGSRPIDRISLVGVELLVVPLLAFDKQSPVNLSTNASPSLPGRIQYSKICM
jgi:hypothetical protein